MGGLCNFRGIIFILELLNLSLNVQNNFDKNFVVVEAKIIGFDLCAVYIQYISKSFNVRRYMYYVVSTSRTLRYAD